MEEVESSFPRTPPVEQSSREIAMKIHRQATIDDMLAFQRYHFANSTAIKKSRMGAYLFLSGTALMVAGAISFQNEDPFAIILAAVFVLLYTFIHFSTSMTRNMVDKQTRMMFSEGANKALFGLHELEITAEAISERSAFHEYTTRWTAVEKIVETADHAFIYWCGLSAYVISRHDIGEETYRTFIDQARRYHQAVDRNDQPTS
jgi:hypothetical protein